MIRSLAHLASDTSRSAVRLATLLAVCLCGPISAAAATMEPIRFDGTALPLPKPDFASLLPGELVDMTVPLSRPDLSDILPKSTATLAEMVLAQTGQQSTREDVYKLQSGEGLATLLARAGFTRADASAAINEVIGRASLRALPVGLEVRATEHGFAFSTKSGREIYALRDPEEGWMAFTAIRPVERYVAYAQGIIDDSIVETEEPKSVLCHSTSNFWIHLHIDVLSYSFC